MMNFLKKHGLDILLAIMLVLVLFVVDTPLPQSAEAFDYLATIGWTSVPFALCWLLLRVSSVLKVVGEAKATDLLASAGERDATTWRVRHETKAFRKSHAV